MDITRPRSTAFMEHRWGTRFALSANTAVEAAHGGYGRGRITDASISGAFVETSLNLPLLSRVTLRPGDMPGVVLEACVVRRTDHGVGLEWLEPGLREVTALIALRDALPPRPLGNEPDRHIHSRSAA